MLLPPRNDTLQLKSNPLNWSVKKVVEFMKTTDCAGLSKIFKDQVCFFFTFDKICGLQ